MAATIRPTRVLTTNAGTPVSGATVTVYYRGATVNGGHNVTTGTAPVTVHYTGAFLAGDTFQVGTDASRTGSIIGVTNATTLSVQGSSSFSLVNGERLVVTNRQPTTYTDEKASASAAITTDSSGEATFYCVESLFDYAVSGTGLTTELVTDAAGGWTSDFYNVKDFLTVQAALDVVPAYSVLYFPPGTYTAPSAAGWEIDKPLTLQGSGSGAAQGSLGGSILAPYSSGGSTANSTVLTVTSGDVTIRDLMVADPNGNTTAGTGVGIKLYAEAATISNIKVERCWVYYMGSHGVQVTRAGGYTVDLAVIEDVISNTNKGAGLHGVGFAYPQIRGGYFAGNTSYGIYLESSGNVRLFGVSTQNNQSGSSTAEHSQVRIKTCEGLAIVGCAIEGFGAYTCKTGIILDTVKGGIISGCFILNEDNASGASSLGILLENDCYGNHIFGNAFSWVDTYVTVQGAANNNWGNTVGMNTPIGVGASTRGLYSVATDNYNKWDFPLDNGSALWGGIQVPPVSSAAAVLITPQLGMLIWDVAATRLKVWNGAAWQVVGAQT